ncbi:MAG: endolytic transglycosylase MltG [Prevotella sp.]|nr:endolytic transglycosylase MltG [Prevotella sp.]
MKQLNKKHYALIIVAVLLLVAAGFAYYYYRQISAQVLSQEETHYLYIDNDDSADSVYAKLAPVSTAEGLKGLKRLASYYDYDQHLRTGRYAIEPGAKAIDVFRMLRNGQQSPIMLTIPEVRTMDKMAARLSSKLMLDSATIAQALTSQTYCQQLGYDTTTIACIFVPNTYEVYWNTSLDALMQRMQKEHDSYWNDERRKKAENQGLTPNEAVILASIIDEETANNAEKPMIAGMYLNRLKRGMLLQADPTVKFALKDFTLRRILNRHLEVDSPYNTYKYAGLMPGPIRVPSLQAIEAVLNPAQHDYLYMCAKEDFSGTHNFARTLSEHNQNARRYQQALNKMGIR